jgi:hypothetical protein
MRYAPAIRLVCQIDLRPTTQANAVWFPEFPTAGKRFQPKCTPLKTSQPSAPAGPPQGYRPEAADVNKPLQVMENGIFVNWEKPVDDNATSQEPGPNSVPFVLIGRWSVGATPLKHGTFGITSQFDSHTLPPKSR